MVISPILMEKIVHSYAIEQRLRMIDFLLSQYGHINRSALISFFGISVPQASADIRMYLDIAPGNAAYDAVAKSYIRGGEFSRIYP